MLHAGLLTRQDGNKGNFAALKRAFRLILDDIDDKNPTDIAYVFSGYAPLSVRCCCCTPSPPANTQCFEHVNRCLQIFVQF